MNIDELEFPYVIPPEPSKMGNGAKKKLIENLYEIELKAWGEDMAFTLSHLFTHLNVFPEGMLIAYLNREDCLAYKPCAWGLVQIIKENPEKPIHSWWGVTDDGFIFNTHNPNGDWLYGVNLSVPRGVPSSITQMIVNFAKDIAIKKNLKGIMLGSRIPRYYKYSFLDVKDYVTQKIGQKYKDPELARYQSLGFEIAENEDGEKKILKNYFEDPSSLNYGVLMIWRRGEKL